MTSNVRMILNEVNARIKLAEAKTAEDPSNFDSFPGAENDKAVPAETKKPDPEVKDEGPASRTEASGATPGSDDKVNQDHLYEADQPVLTPEKKPADSADANAKVAEAKDANPEITKVASDILAVIKEAMTKTVEKKAEEGSKEAACGGGSCTKDPKEATCAKKDPKKATCGGGSCTKDTKEATCGEGSCTNDPKEAACGGGSCAKDPKEATCAKKDPKKATCAKAPTEKRAKSESISLGHKILDKIASARREALEKEAGANDAVSLIKAAMEYRKGADDAKALIQKLAQALEESAASGEAAAENGAVAPEAAGAADAEAAIADAGAAAAAEGADAVTPEEVAQAVSELVSEGQISDAEAATLVEQLGGGEAAPAGDISEDELAQGIVDAVQSGAISEEEAQQLAQELVGAGADETLKDDVAANDAAAAAMADEGAAAEAAGAADAAAAVEDVKKAEASLKKEASDEQIARYQKGFIAKCAEYGVDPQAVARYIQAKAAQK